MKKLTFFGIVLALISFVMVCSVPAAQLMSGVAPKGPPEGFPPQAHADKDGNSISDGLQAKLTKLAPQDMVDVVVTFQGPSDIKGAQAAVSPFRVKRQFKTIPGFAATMTAAQVMGLARTPGIFRVEEDFKVTTMLDAARSDYGIDLVQEVTMSFDGDGIGICVIDSGVDPGHEQLDGGKVAGFVDFVNGQAAAYDDHGHGTHVAAIAAGAAGAGDSSLANRFRGVAPGASIYGAKALSAAGSGYESDIIAAIDWCTYVDPNAPNPVVRQDVHIISMSLGTALPSDGEDALSQAVNSAVDQGKVMVVAAGNSGGPSEKVGSPGAAAQAITVAAVAEWSVPATTEKPSYGVFLANFSSRGPTLDGRIKPDIAAPGVKVTAAHASCGAQLCTLGLSEPPASIFLNYVTLSGTSMATPFVSGSIALYLQAAGSGWTPAGVKQDLMGTAQDRGALGLDTDWGAGLIDGYSFVEMAQGETSPETAFPTTRKWLDQEVNNNTEPWTVTFDGGIGEEVVPVAVTVNVKDICTFEFQGGCLIREVPWLDVTLRDLEGNVVTGSTFHDLCGFDSVGCGSAVLTMYPTTQTQYTLEVSTHVDDPGGGFHIDVSLGPMGGVEPPTGPSNLLPTADFSYGVAELSVNFTDLSSDDDGTIKGWSWGFGDGDVSSEQNPVHTYSVAGNYSVSLTVTDDNGSTDTTSQVVSVNSPGTSNTPPVVTIKSPADGSTFDSGAKTRFAGSASDSEDGDVTDSLVWTSDLDGEIGRGGRFFARLGDGNHTITAEAVDSVGATAAGTIAIEVGNVTPPESSLHIGDLDDGGAVSSKSGWKAIVQITVHDSGESTVADVLVNGVWSGGSKGNTSCTTTTEGRCTVTREMKKIDSGVTFTVSDVAASEAGFLENHDPDEDSDGTSIRVNKP